MRAKMIPSVMAFRIAAQMDCKATIHADSQQSVGDLTPYPDQQIVAVLMTQCINALHTNWSKHGVALSDAYGTEERICTYGLLSLCGKNER